MAFKAIVTVEYEDVELNMKTHRATATLHDKVPEELGDISYQEYKHIAAQQAVSHYMADRILVPVKDEDDTEASYVVVYQRDIRSISVHVAKTLDVK